MIQAPVHLRIGHLSTFYHTSVLLAAQRQRASGLGIEWRLFATGPDIIRAFEKREIDAAYIGLPPAIIGISRGLDLRCVAGGHIEGTVLCAGTKFRGFPAIQNLEELLHQFRGHAVGVPGSGSIHDVIIQDCLDRFHLRGEIELINYPWADAIIDAMAQGRVAAAAGTPALAVALTRYANGAIVYPPSLLWPYNPSYGIVARRNLIHEERGALADLVTAHEGASSLLRKDPEEAARIISLSVGVIDSGFIRETIGISPRYCAQITHAYIRETLRFADTMTRLGFLKREVAAEEIFDTSIVEEIHPPGDHYETPRSSWSGEMERKGQNV